ncbi:hypothetical protein ERJ75_000322400 [Trypanosoma vivax]|nr:hypothetical protein ERJ75_000322400 [Trypanosoma vivax]
MHPSAVLEAPVEIQVLRFNPLKPNLIAGGAMNGQLFLWDVNKATASTASKPSTTNQAADTNLSSRADGASKDILSMPMSVKGLSVKRDGDVLVPHLQPSQWSRVELSHRRPCTIYSGCRTGWSVLLTESRQSRRKDGSLFHSVMTVTCACGT